MAWFRARSVDRELEAPIQAPCGGTARGKAERKWYKDGTAKLSLRARDLDLPDGAVVKLKIAGRYAATAIVRGGALKLEIETGPDLAVPEADAGESIVIEHRGEIVATGDFRPD